MRLIESYTDDGGTVEIEGRTLPATCLVEDEDGIRIFIGGTFPESTDADVLAVPARDWVRAHAAGARLLAAADPGETGGWWIATAEAFMDERSEHPPTRTFRLSTQHVEHYEDLPAYREVAVQAMAQRVVEDEAAKVEAGEITGFVHLHTHSEYSPLDGMSEFSEIVREVARHGQQAVAGTDHGTCAGHPDLQAEAEKAGIKPIFGIEANFVDDRFRRGDEKVPGDAKRVLADYSHLVLLAQTDRGLRNLWAASTEANRDGFYQRPRMDWETLEKFNEGIIATTGCLRGPVARKILDGDEDGARSVLARLLAIFGDRLYIEIHTNSLPEQRRVNEALIGLAREYRLPLVAAADSHYPTPKDKRPHAVWIASQTDKDLTDDADLFAGDCDYHISSEAEVRAALAYLGPQVVDEAVENTARIATLCNARVKGETTTPVFSKAPTREQAIQRDVERLVELCLSNWEKRCTGPGKKFPVEEYEARFEMEMKLLIDKGFCGYYLMVSDYCRWARRNGILVGPGRGSGSGSLVAYLSDITGIDPVETGLMFERFLTPGRTSLPDFDVDFPSSKRGVLTDYIVEKYGRENVVRVGTHMRLKNKGVVRSMARVLKTTIDIHYPDIDAVSKIIEVAEGDKAGLGMSWEALWDEHGEVLQPFRDKYPLLFEYCDALVGRLHAYGKHPAGVVIAPDANLVNEFPMRLAGDDLVIEFDMDAAEKVGLVKFDLLTLRTLDTIQQAVDNIREQRGDEINVYDWADEYLDPQVWDEISDGHTLGIFQIETPGGTRDTKQFQPHSIDELADVITLVRPGPKRSGLTETYHRRKFEGEEVTVPDPRLEPVLAGTYGCMIYQEQVINTCRVLGDYTSEEADDVRRLLGKKKVEQVAAAGQKFRAMCAEQGTDEQVAAFIWEQMAEFAKYSFNRSHAYGYAILGYWTAWLKFHYPVQFLTAVLSTVDKHRIPEFINEARRMGYRVLPPDVNLSGEGFRAGQMEVRYGFDSVKGIGEAAMKAILQGQPYADWDDFLARKGPGANAGHIKMLARVGTFDSLVPNRRLLERRLEWETDGSADRCQFKDETVVATHGLPCSFDWDSEPVPLGKRGQPLKKKPLPKKCTKACRQWLAPVLDLTAVPPYTDDEIMDREMELLGVHLSATPFDRIPAEVMADPAMSLGDEVDHGPNGEYMIPAVITKVRPHTTRTGKPMGFLGMYAVNADLDVTVFTEAWEAYQRDLKKGTLCLAVIFKNDRGITLTALQPL